MSARHLATAHPLGGQSRPPVAGITDDAETAGVAAYVLVGIQVVAGLLAGLTAPPEVEAPAWVGIGVMFVAAYYVGAMLFVHTLDRLLAPLLRRSVERLGYTLCGLGVVAGLVVFRGGLLGELFVLLATSSLLLALLTGLGMLIFAGLARRSGGRR
jgi:hypothetical protein